MNTDFEKEATEDLKRRKKNFRAFTRNLSPTEKIRQLEFLQRHYCELLKARETDSERKIPKNGESGAMPKIFAAKTKESKAI